MDELTPEAVAERIRATTVAVELAAALDYWASARRATRGTEDAGWRRLLEVARRANPHEWRCRLRDALAARDRKALEDLAKAHDVAELPAASLGTLGKILCRLDAPDQAVELLRAAQRRHPADFWISHHLAWALEHLNPAQLEEAIPSPAPQLVLLLPSGSPAHIEATETGELGMELVRLPAPQQTRE